jgi:peptidyl-tRNA hydrolase, PTH1 family
MKLIVGLGNIGQEYEKTRHNVGFMLIDELIGAYQLPACVNNDKFKAQIVEGQIGHEKVLLVKPTTMMNLSGEAVGSLARFYKLDAGDIWVLYDEVDLAFGKLRIRQDGGSAGHNGIKSIIDAVGEGFVRFRFGVGTERHPNHDTADYVLGQFTPQEQEKLPAMLEEAAKMLTEHLEDKIEDTTYSLI